MELRQQILPDPRPAPDQISGASDNPAFLSAVGALVIAALTGTWLQA